MSQLELVRKAQRLLMLAMIRNAEDLLEDDGVLATTIDNVPVVGAMIEQMAAVVILWRWADGNDEETEGSMKTREW